MNPQSCWAQKWFQEPAEDIPDADLKEFFFKKCLQNVEDFLNQYLLNP